MPAEKPVLTGLALALALVLLAPDGARAEEARLLFTGDILLSRQVEAEIARTGHFPWTEMLDEFGTADLVLANLEGAVGKAEGCLPGGGRGPCFPIAIGRVALLARAGFSALSVENNHAGDLGDEGREATRRALREAGIRPVGFEDGPSFFRVGGVTVAVMALNLVPGRDGRVQTVPSPEIRRQLRLASWLANLVIVDVHWGEELLEWPSRRQREAARWLVENGASVIAGHHPHVVQPPECVDGRPVFFSLGNHLFDQKYEATKEGLVADCRIKGDTLSCSAFATRTARGSFRPVPAAGGARVPAPLAACPVHLSAGLAIGDTVLRPAPGDGSSLILEGLRDGQVVFRTRPVRTLSAEAVPFGGEGSPPRLLTLERHRSPIDGEEGVRPYVYEVGPKGLVARWRGSALAWPLVDATALPGSAGLLCALHRRDAFLTLDDHSPADRAAVYRWNGFGFTGVDDAAPLVACRALWGL